MKKLEAIGFEQRLQLFQHFGKQNSHTYGLE
jgi:hypothetical protein